MITEQRASQIKDRLYDIREEMVGQLDELRQIVDELDDEYMKAYLIDQLACKIHSEHGFMTNEANIDTLIERVNEAVEYDEEDE